MILDVVLDVDRVLAAAEYVGLRDRDAVARPRERHPQLAPAVERVARLRCGEHRFLVRRFWPAFRSCQPDCSR